MKSIKHVAFLLALLISVGFISSCSRKDNVNQETPPPTEIDTYGAKSAMADDALTIDKMLQYAIQDEYLARSQYEAFIETFGEKIPFPQIKNSEVYHIEELKKLFMAHTLDISEDQSKKYVVKVNDFEKALQTSIDLEQENIEMYQKFLDMELPDDIFATFSMLRNDSMAHAAEFERNKKK